MSIATYNSVQLPYAHITQFEQKVMYDEEGHTDWYVTQFDIRIQTVINVDYLASLAPSLLGNVSASNPAAVMVAIRKALLTPRKQLSLKFNGIELIPQISTTSPGNTTTTIKTSVDAQNGPQPQACTFHMMTNTTFLLTWHVIAKYWEHLPNNLPNDANVAGNVVLYNRWMEAVDLDELQMTTRIRQGKIVIRSDNYKGIVADQARTAMATTGVPSGFLRQSSRYQVDPSGLALQYTIVDKEVFKMPPGPAYTATGMYREYFTHTGAQRHGMVDVTLRASKLTSQATLISSAIRVASGKLFLGATSQANGAIGFNGIAVLENFDVRCWMYENAVQVILQGRFKSQTDGIDGVGISPTLPIVPGSDVYTSLVTRPAPNSGTFVIKNITPVVPAYAPYGTAGYLLQAAAYFDPSLSPSQEFLNTTTGNISTGIQPGQAATLGDAGIT